MEVIRKPPYIDWWVCIMIWIFIVGTVYLLENRDVIPAPKQTRPPYRGELYFSEVSARTYLEDLTSTIGLRVVGTKQYKESRDYIVNALEELKKKATNPNISNFEISVQDVSGSHVVSMAGKTIMKRYLGAENIVAKLSCGKECDDNIILVNTHYDSTMSTPGAGDSVAMVSVMLELVRSFTQSVYKPKNTLVLVWNGAEESLFDGAHGFFKEYADTKNIKALVNLDAVGNHGGEVLFQTNSDLMIKTFSKVPRPHGSTMCNDFFRLKLILSDTDYGKYLSINNKIHGMDIALYKNAYVYHTMLDIAPSFPKGSLQGLGDNTLIILKELLKTENIDQENTEITYLYNSFMRSRFIMVKWSHARMAAATLLLSICVYIASFIKREAKNYLMNYKTMAKMQLVALVFYVLSLISGELTMFVFSFINPIIFKNEMAWFSSPYSLVLLLSLTLYSGLLLPQVFLPNVMNKVLKRSSILVEDKENNTKKLISRKFTYIGASQLAGKLSNNSSILASALFSFGLSLINFGYMQLWFIFSLFGLIGAVVEELLNKTSLSKTKNTYTISLVIHTFCFFFVLTELMDVTSLLVPLSGISGANTLIDTSFYILFPLFLYVPISVFVPTLNRLYVTQKTKRRLFAGLVIVTLLTTCLYGAFVFPYDQTHPKRSYVIHIDNKNKDNVVGIHFSDPGHTENVIEGIKNEFNLTDKVNKTSSLPSSQLFFYPFNEYLDGEDYVLDTSSFPEIEEPSDVQNFSIKVMETEYNEDTNIKSSYIVINHEGYIYLSIEIDAEIISWDAVDCTDCIKKNERHKYIIKECSGYGVNQSAFNITYKYTKDNKPRITVVGVRSSIFRKLKPMSSDALYAEMEVENTLPASVFYGRVVKSLPTWVSPMVVSLSSVQESL